MDTTIRILLDQIASQTRKRYMENLRELNLHVGQDQMICHLDFHEQLNQVELASILQCEASTISNMVRALTKHDLITKEPDQHDKRTTVIRLTPEGKNLVPAIHHSWDEFQAELLNGLSLENKEQLADLLTVVTHNLTKM